MAATIAVYALTPAGLDLARRLARGLDGAVFAPERLAGPGETGFAALGPCLAGNFRNFQAHVCVAAAGILVRLLAPLLGSKGRDPAVLALDPAGKFCVSLLSGHLGGANDLARRVAAITGGEAVITTATDCAGLPSLDLLAREKGLRIADLAAVKRANAALLEGRALRVQDPEKRLGDLDPALFEPVDQGGDVVVGWSRAEGPALALHPPVLWAGVGCRRGTQPEEILGLLEQVFAEEGLALPSLAGLASVEDKRGETGLLAAAGQLAATIRFFSREELAGVPVVTPSAAAREHLGLEGVCEAAAVLAANGRLLVPKRKTARATLAVALAG